MLMNNDAVLKALWRWLYTLPPGEFVRNSDWAWPVLESFHFTGMAVLVGVVGLFDLRLMGFARGVPVLALHRLIPLGLAGFSVNVLTGYCFLTAMPYQYLFNSAFHYKVLFLGVAGLNVLVFYSATFRRLAKLDADGPPPLAARVAGAVSLCAWVGVMSAGRLLTFFRPI
jgi:hypothetical protein